MLSDLRKSLNRRNLTDPAFDFLFDEDTSGEVVALAVGASSFEPEQAELQEIVAIVIRGNRLLASQRLHLKIGAQGDVQGCAGGAAQGCAGSVSAPDAVAALLHFAGSRPLVGYFLDFAVNLIDKTARPLIGVAIPNARTEVSSLYYDRRRPVAGRTVPDLRFDAILRDLELPERGIPHPFADAVSAGLIYLTLQAPQRT
jgi:DNA polymerase III subunit epsilon